VRARGALIHGDLGELSVSADCWATDLSPISQADRLHEALVRLSASFRFDAPAERRDFRLEESPLSFKWRKWAAKLNLPIPDCEGYSR
jgi:hypothetical protein